MTEEEYKFNLNQLEVNLRMTQSLVSQKSTQPVYLPRSALDIGSSDEVSRRRDDIYFNKMGLAVREKDFRSREKGFGSRELTTEASRMEKSRSSVNPEEEKTKRHYSEMEDSKDLGVVREKIERLMRRRETEKDERAGRSGNGKNG